MKSDQFGTSLPFWLCKWPHLLSISNFGLATRLSNTTIKSSIFQQYFDGFVKNTLNALGSVVINIKSFHCSKKICWKSDDTFRSFSNVNVSTLYVILTAFIHRVLLLTFDIYFYKHTYVPANTPYSDHYTIKMVTILSPWLESIVVPDIIYYQSWW